MFLALPYLSFYYVSMVLHKHENCAISKIQNKLLILHKYKIIKNTKIAGVYNKKKKDLSENKILE